MVNAHGFLYLFIMEKATLATAHVEKKHVEDGNDDGIEISRKVRCHKMLRYVK